MSTTTNIRSEIWTACLIACVGVLFFTPLCFWSLYQLHQFEAWTPEEARMLRAGKFASWAGVVISLLITAVIVFMLFAIAS